MEKEEQIRELEEIKLDIENVMSRVSVFIGDCGTVFTYLVSPEDILANLGCAEESVEETINSIKEEV